MSMRYATAFIVHDEADHEVAIVAEHDSAGMVTRWYIHQIEIGPPGGRGERIKAELEESGDFDHVCISGMVQVPALVVTTGRL